MKALVLKDWYVVFKQMRLFLVFILVFSLLPGTSANLFAVVYAAMLPYTALAYDERCKWDQLAAMMPYSERDIVLGKYVLGWLFTAGAMVFCMAAQLVMSPFTHARPDVAGTLLVGCAGTVIMACILPLMFRFGVERGRMFFIMFVVAGAIGATSAITVQADALETRPALLTVLLPAAAVVLNAVSIPLSIRLYRRCSR